MKHRCGESFWLISLHYRRRTKETGKLGGVALLGVDSDSFIQRRTYHSNSAHSTMLTIVTRRSTFTSFTALFTAVIPTSDSVGTTTNHSSTITTTNHSTNINITSSPVTLINREQKKNVFNPLLIVVSPIEATKPLTDTKSVAYNSLDFNKLHPMKRKIEQQQKYGFSKLSKRVADYDYEFEESDNKENEDDTDPSRDNSQLYTHELGLPLVGAILFTSINFCEYIIL